MKSAHLAIVCLATLFSLGACSFSKVSHKQVNLRAMDNVKVIAVSPGGGLLADAVGVELANRGFTIIDPTSTTNMLIRLNLSEIEIVKPENLAKLNSQGIDAYLVVRAAGSRYDDQPQSASCRINSTIDGQLLVGVTWQNGFGGKAGSPADRVMRKGLTEAANEISDAFAKRATH